MNKFIYLNNSGTSYHKPDVCASSFSKAFGLTPKDLWSEVETIREEFQNIFNIPESHTTLFTNGCTAGINILLNSMDWNPKDCIISTGMEHYACTGTIDSLVQNAGVIHKIVPYHPNNIFCFDTYESLLTENNVKLLVCCHGSNLTGDVFPIKKIAKMAHLHGALVLVDFAQTAGIIPINVRELEADLCAFTGHKGLHGPLGVGIISIDSRVKLARSPATCDFSKRTCQTSLSFCDIGSVNTPAIIALGATCKWLFEKFPQGTRVKTIDTFQLLIEKLEKLPLNIFYTQDAKTNLPVVSFVPKNGLLQDLVKLLFAGGFYVGSGQLCAPLAQKSLDTENTGVLRISSSIFNTQKEILDLIEYLRNCLMTV